MVTGLLRSSSPDGIPIIKGLSSIYVHATQAHGIRKISHMHIPSFGSKRK